MVTALKKLIFILDEILAASALGFIVLLTVSGVFLRYVMNRPLPWQEEVSMVAVVWLVFMGASVVAKRSAHLGIDSLVRSLPPRPQRLWNGVVNTGVLIVLALVFFYATKLTLQTQKSTTILKIPYQFVYGAVPIGVSMMLFHCGVQLYKTHRRPRSTD